MDSTIRRLMEAHRMTTEQLKKKSGYSKAAIFSWRRGARKPTWEACKVLGKVFGMTTARLYEETR